MKSSYLPRIDKYESEAYLIKKNYYIFGRGQYE